MDWAARFGGGGVRRLDRDDELAGIGKMFLIELEPLHRGNIPGEQAQDVSVKVQSQQPGDHRRYEDGPPPTKPRVPHGRYPSNDSPVHGFSRRQELSGRAANFHGGARFSAGNRPRQLKPDKPPRRRAASAPGVLAVAKRDLPCAVRLPRRCQGERRFGKLNEAIAIVIRCQQ